MSVRRARGLLLVALAFSLLLHLIFAGVIRWPRFGRPQEEPQVVTIRHVTIARLPRRTPPPPPPSAPPSIVPSAAPRAVHHVAAPAIPHLNASRPLPGRAGPASGLPQPGRAHTPVPTPAPLPATTSSPVAGCAHPRASPQVIATPGPQAIAGDVRARKVSGTASIAVALDQTGRVTDTKVAQSSGNPGLDVVATAMARDAQYSPGYADCKAVASTYTFTVKFVAW